MDLMRKLNAWAGIWLLPTEHESSFSAVMRFAWQNAMDARAIKQFLTGKALSLNGDSFLHPTWLSKNGLKNVGQWDLPNVYERKISANFTDCEALFFSHLLRICPICFAAGFHSHWHQLVAQHFCLIHDCLLIDRCQFCGQKFGAYSLTKDLFNQPYCCHACGAPVAGANTMLEEIISLRSEVATTDRFAATGKWFTSACENFYLLRAVAQCSNTPVHLLKGSRRGRLLLDFANLLNPVPASFSWESEPAPLTILTWNIRCRPFENQFYLKNRKDLTRCRINRDMARTLYTVALRRIHTWILSSQSCEYVDAIQTSLCAGEEFDLNECGAAAIALFLFRRCFESNPDYNIKKHYRPYGFRFDHQPPFQMYLSAECEPRIAYYGVYLAIYAALYWKARHGLASGSLDLAHQIGNVDEFLTKFLLRSPDRLAGGVIFRTVPGLPLPRFLESTVDVAKRTLTQAAGFQIISGRFG